MTEHPLSLVRSPVHRRGLLGALAAAGSAPLLTLGALPALRLASGAARAATCLLTPSLTEGPYWVDEKLNRSDLTTNTTRAGVTGGLPLTLTITVLRYGATSCDLASGVQVDLWQADALGTYSDVSGNGQSSTVGQSFLRGYQVTDATGTVNFTTIFPGWYSGRTAHIHLRARVFDASGNVTYNFTTQLFFSDTITDIVYAAAPYNSRGTRDTRNANDSIYSASMVVPLTARASGGYSGAISIGLQNLPATAAASAATPQTGLWYTPGSGGRGFGIEVSGTAAHVGVFSFDSLGRDVWYAGAGTLSGSTLSGTLARYSGGNSLADLSTTARVASVAEAVAAYALTFTSASAGTAKITPVGGSATTYALTRFPIDGSAIADPPSFAPQTGWWYAPDHGGVGFFLDLQDSVTSAGVTYGRLFAVFMLYGSDGSPIWYTTSGLIGANGSGALYSGSLTELSGGPGLTGSSGTIAVASSPGTVTLAFTTSAAGTLALPDGTKVAIKRYAVA